jgi:predicted ATPase/DNA-binding XRE family transcriptional regulator
MLPPQVGADVRVLTLGDVLRQLRMARGMTQEDLAQAAGGSISVDTVANVERGRTRPYRHTVQALLAALEPADDDQAAVWDAWRAMARDRSELTNGAASEAAAPRLSPLTPLIGRQREIQHLTELLGNGARLVTLTGPGGVGKTRLALAVADVLTDRFAHGAVVVDLAPTRDPRLVLAAIAQALGLPDTSDQPYRDRLVAHLRESSRLLVLDNLEPVVEAAPELADVLTACPRVKALATSRVALRVRGEREVPVAPLKLPAPGNVGHLATLVTVPSVALLVERAQAAAPGFLLTAENAGAVAAICTRLDGLPLALELAAAWLRLLPPAALLARLERALSVLVDGPRDLPPRQRTLRATIDWSYSRLAEPEQRLLRRLSVFAGGCTVEAAESVGADADTDSTLLTRLAALVDANLLRVRDADGQASTMPRLTALETIREYGAEQLEASGEAVAVHRRHAQWCLAFAETAEPHMTTGGRKPWLDRLAAEHDNMRAALTWCLATDGELETGLRLAHALIYYWYLNGYHTEGRRWMAEYLAHPHVADFPRLRAQALYGAGKLAWTQGDIAQGSAYLAQGAELFTSVCDDTGVARCLSNLVPSLVLAGDPAAALAAAERGIAHAHAPCDAWVLAQLLNHSAQALGMVGDYPAARARLADARQRYQAIGDPWGIAVSHFFEGELEECHGDNEAAASAFARGSAHFRESEERFGLAWTTLRHAYVRLRIGDVSRARELLAESLAASRDLGHTTFVLWGLVGCSAIAAHDAKHQAATRLSARASVLLDAPAGVGGSSNMVAREIREQTLGKVRQMTNAEVLRAETAVGEAMSIEESIALGMRVIGA